MYTKSIPFKDLNGKPHNTTVHFKFFVRDVMKNLVELKTVFDWLDSMKGEERELETQEVVDFYNSFEELLLAAWGVPSSDGLKFNRSGRYEFEESALFDACMTEFVTNPMETGKLLEGMLPDNMEELVKKADANMLAAASAEKNEDVQAELHRLRAQLAERTGVENVDGNEQA